MPHPTIRPLLAFFLTLTFACSAPAQQHIHIDASAPATPFPHFWEEMFGSGRAILSLRESYRDDLRAVKQATDFHYVRFHAILHDEVGVYNEDEHGNPVYNFTYVDEIYDGLLKNGVKPVVEISFMPRKLAFNPDALHPFWYKQNVSPPKSMERWDDLIGHFAQHLVDRYGIDEVSSWYFEVWNEPNIDFWGGIPRMESYFDLYAHTANDLKHVNSRLRVGGPATAAAAWIPEFLKFTSTNHVPVDFVSTHGYDDEPVERLLGSDQPLRDKDMPEEDRVCAAANHVRKQIDASAYPHLPLLWTEWNVPGRDRLRDTPYVGPALAEAVRTCRDVQALSFWTFSDVFEEGGPAQRSFDGQFGLRATGGINKASFYDFALLHKLGTQRIASDADDIVVTKLPDGSLAIALWNLAPTGQSPVPKSVTLDLTGIAKDAKITIQRVDDNHSNVMKPYAAMGSPSYPKPEQVEQLNRETVLEPPQPLSLTHGSLTLNMDTNALVLIKVAP
ncbi:xylan 1,4-beta-xylosidase [Granulicella aggregans]|uniref:Xylan 1,4-beta-xylosidase n=1 Tax=Granulicella aggregans TaxID=474949 RepID=A0A7W7ZAV8_9BACT|nr:glycosyl hydrolase family 39 [Granulicella aggregans]MBB5056413.1 xylan 1,4-beta-xylosidase [Granulicella aggregans]